MKQIIVTIIMGVCIPHMECVSQNKIHGFYTIGTVSELPCHKENCMRNVVDTLDVAFPSNDKDAQVSGVSVEESMLLAGKHDDGRLAKGSLASLKIPNNNSKVYSYYPWKPRVLDLRNLKDVVAEVGLSNKLFVLAQAVLETGNFNSRVCREYNNLFGLYDSKNRDYYRFARWEDSVVGYGRMIQYRYKGGNYLHFLKRIGYAEDPQYIAKIAKVAKSIYYTLFKE